MREVDFLLGDCQCFLAYVWWVSVGTLGCFVCIASRMSSATSRNIVHIPWTNVAVLCLAVVVGHGHEKRWPCCFKKSTTRFHQKIGSLVACTVWRIKRLCVLFVFLVFKFDSMWHVQQCVTYACPYSTGLLLHGTPSLYAIYPSVNQPRHSTSVICKSIPGFPSGISTVLICCRVNSQ